MNRKVSIARLMVFAAIGLFGLAAAANAAGTLTVCTQAAPEGFDIAQYESISTNDASGLALYDQLVEFKPGTTELVPGLAEKWDVSADELQVTMHLRRGVKFHSTPWFTPTRDFNADDVLFSMRRLNDKADPFHGIAKNGYVYWEGMGMPALLKSVDKIDDATVRFTLTRPEAPFLANLTITSIGSIFSAEYAAKLLKEGRLDAFNTQPVGTGPFILKSYQKDAVVRYAANAAYWGGKPPIDNLIFAVTRDDDTRIQRVKAGECLVGIGMKPENAAAFDDDPKNTLIRVPVLRTSMIAPNVKRKFLSDKRFREAISLAIDRPGLVKNVYGGNAKAAGSFIPPGIWSHDPALAARHDLDRAKELVKASGYDGSELSLVINAGGGTRAGELVQSDLARVGIKVRVELVEIGELLKRAGRGDFDLPWISWYSDNGDPDNFLTPNLSCAAVAGGGNKSQWCDAEFDALIAAARKTSDKAKRTEIYVRAQQRIAEQVATIPVAYPLVLTAVNKRVHGFSTNLFGNNDFRSARVD